MMGDDVRWCMARTTLESRRSLLWSAGSRRPRCRHQTRPTPGATRRRNPAWAANDAVKSNLNFAALGASLDFRNEYFTLDEERSRAVEEAFVRLWDAQLVYRALRMVHWCPRLLTALSDLEVDKRQIDSPTHIRLVRPKSPFRSGRRRGVQSRLRRRERRRVDGGDHGPHDADRDCVCGRRDRRGTPSTHVSLVFVGRLVRHPLIPGKTLQSWPTQRWWTPPCGTGAVKVTPRTTRTTTRARSGWGCRSATPSFATMNDGSRPRSTGICRHGRFAARAALRHPLRRAHARPRHGAAHVLSYGGRDRSRAQPPVFRENARLAEKARALPGWKFAPTPHRGEWDRARSRPPYESTCCSTMAWSCRAHGDSGGAAPRVREAVHARQMRWTWRIHRSIGANDGVADRQPQPLARTRSRSRRARGVTLTAPSTNGGSTNVASATTGSVFPGN